MTRWDARGTFSIDPKATPSFTCVGIATSMNRKCQNPIGKPRRITAVEILDEVSALPISGQDYNERGLKAKMKELLGEVLCGKHRDGGGYSQAEKLGKEWWGKVQMAQAAMRNDGGRRPAQMIQRRREHRPVADAEPIAAERALQRLEFNPIIMAAQIQVLENRLARDEAERAELMTRIEERWRLYERIQEEQRRARERREEAMLRREEEERRREAERIQRERQREANRIRDEREEMVRMDREFALRLQREEEEEAELRREEEAEAEAEAQQQRAARRAARRVENRRQVQVLDLIVLPQLFQPHPVQREVQRKPLGDCYSCLEPIRRHKDADWCRAQCGQNICNRCLQEWMKNQVGRELTCGVWFAVPFFSSSTLVR
ncbi:uncharacterized protein EAF01_007834 [Botrytis porri]|uniref:uncharacterized protein n=1 Tax=Botrytis porri TaxID=87229 RepID=UPI001901EC41|nr:uncharacterized protein EAF01_007834 [Botrytis porri]KAF7900532.1 hypothetical protein EAF01_007834 [Botrytis porri]